LLRLGYVCKYTAVVLTIALDMSSDWITKVHLALDWNVSATQVDCNGHVSDEALNKLSRMRKPTNNLLEDDSGSKNLP